MELLKLKCIFYRTFMYRVKYATASGIIEKHWRSNIKVKTLPMCWKCAWKKHWTFLAISRKSSENCRRLPMLVWDILNSASLRRHCQEIGRASCRERERRWVVGCCVRHKERDVA